MPVKKFSRLDDLEILEMLHLRDNEGMTMRQIGKMFGKTTGQVIGMIDRVRKADAAIPDHCVDPANRNGGMGRRWWI